MNLSAHLLAVPVVLPLVAGALCALLSPRRAAALSLAATVAQALLAATLLVLAAEGATPVLLLGNWAAPYGIALALDRLSALMLALTALVALLALLYARGGEDNRGRHFHALFQLQLMGLAGAFLTTDLFNLFVFFEVLLSASYGLLLHGDDAGRRARLKATLHYVVYNLVCSVLFLFGLGLLYGVTGTLNLADLADRLSTLPPGAAVLAQTATLLLLLVFAVKAALLPLYFWLPEAYAGASAPVAALFAIMTKVGVYAITRTTSLLMANDSGGPLAGLVQPALPALGLATLLVAAAGALAVRRLKLLAAYGVIASSGTLLLAVGLGTAESLGAGLFYLVHSTLAAALCFLLADRVAAARGADELAPRAPLAPPAWAALGLAYVVAAAAVTGLPPLAGFFGKALLLQAAGSLPLAGVVVGGVLLASLGLVVAWARAGTTLFWHPGHAPAAPTTDGPPPPAAHWAHRLALMAGVALVVGLAPAAGPVARYAEAAARQAFDRQAYVQAVRGARPVPPALDIRREMRERGDAP